MDKIYLYDKKTPQEIPEIKHPTERQPDKDPTPKHPDEDNPSKPSTPKENKQQPTQLRL
jgi:hypothetical protein